MKVISLAQALRWAAQRAACSRVKLSRALRNALDVSKAGRVACARITNTDGCRGRLGTSDGQASFAGDDMPGPARLSPAIYWFYGCLTETGNRS